MEQKSISGQPPAAPTIASEHVRNIAKDLILTIVTCGFFNLYVQGRQMDAVNAMIKEEKYHFWSWFGLTLITCGLYHIYHEYRKSTDIMLVMNEPSQQNEPVVCLVLAIFGLGVVADAIQQSHINRYYGVTKL